VWHQDRFLEKFDSLSHDLTEVTANIRNIEARLQNLGPTTSTLPVGRRKRTKAPKLTTTPCHRSPLTNTLHMEVRKHLEDLLSHNPEGCFVSPDEAEGWAQGWNPELNQSCCTIERFRVDLHTPHSAWNKSAARIFILDFARFHQLNDMTSTVYDRIAKAFFTRMKTLRSSYKHLLKPTAMQTSEAQKSRRYARRRGVRVSLSLPNYIFPVNGVNKGFSQAVRDCKFASSTEKTRANDTAPWRSRDVRRRIGNGRALAKSCHWSTHSSVLHCSAQMEKDGYHGMASRLRRRLYDYAED